MALRQFVLAVAVTVLTLAVLRGVDFIERRINNSTETMTLGHSIFDRQSGAVWLKRLLHHSIR